MYENISEIYKKTFNFIYNNIDEDITKLILNKNKIINKLNFNYSNISSDEEFNFAIEQIFVRKKFINKFPLLCKNFNFIFPPRLNCEQSSSEQTAKYKSNIIKDYKTSIDLTGGMGIDSMFFANKATNHLYYEINPTLCNIFKENIKNLNYNNIFITNSNSEIFLQKNKSNYFDLIYIDPDRRKNDQRHFLLNELRPNILNIKNNLLNIGTHILIKLSPMFDISKLENTLTNISEIHVISVENECKELLVLLNQIKNNNIKYYAINLPKNYNILQQDAVYSSIIFTKNDIKEKIINYDLVQKYLYEPNASLMKLACWNLICRKYNLAKLHINSHLFTSNNLINNFPGRKFEVIGIESLDSKKIFPYLDKTKKINLSIRNFPIQIEAIHKKLGTKDGGYIYIFATTTINNKLKLIITKKI